MKTLRKGRKYYGYSPDSSVVVSGEYDSLKNKRPIFNHIQIHRIVNGNIIMKIDMRNTYPRYIIHHNIYSRAELKRLLVERGI